MQTDTEMTCGEGVARCSLTLPKNQVSEVSNSREPIPTVRASAAEYPSNKRPTPRSSHNVWTVTHAKSRAFRDVPRSDQMRDRLEVIIDGLFNVAEESPPDLLLDAGKHIIDFFVIRVNTWAVRRAPARRAGSGQGGQVVLDVCIHVGKRELNGQYGGARPHGEQGRPRLRLVAAGVVCVEPVATANRTSRSVTKASSWNRPPVVSRSSIISVTRKYTPLKTPAPSPAGRCAREWRASV